MEHVTKAFVNQNEVEVEAVKKEFKDKMSKDLDFLVRIVLLPRDDKTLGAYLRAVPIPLLNLSSRAAERCVGSNSAQVRTPMFGSSHIGMWGKLAGTLRVQLAALVEEDKSDPDMEPANVDSSKPSSSRTVDNVGESVTMVVQRGALGLDQSRPTDMSESEDTL